MLAKEKQYIIYNDEDMPVFIGTNKECAIWLGISMNSFYVMLNKSKKGIGHIRKYRVYLIEEDNEENGKQ
jgi:hypothetical protein